MLVKGFFASPNPNSPASIMMPFEIGGEEEGNDFHNLSESSNRQNQPPGKIVFIIGSLNAPLTRSKFKIGKLPLDLIYDLKKRDGLVKSPSTGRGRLSPSLG